MSLLSWALQRLSLTDPKKWHRVLSQGLWAGKPVTIESAMQLSAWWASVRLYARVTGAMPLKFYERLDNDDRKQVRDNPIAELIALQPNADQHPQEFWGGQAASLALLGNAYSEKRMEGTRVTALQPLPLDTMPIRNPATDELFYHFTDRGKAEKLPRDKVLHIRDLVLGTGDVGLSPLAAARQGLSISLATEEAAGKHFAQGMRASGYFTVPTKMSPEQRADFTRTFIEPIVGNDASAHYGLLELGTDFKPINIPPRDAEMLVSRRFNIEDICRFMGTPPILVGHAAEGQTMWGCLPAETKVLTVGGPVNILDVKVGDVVWTLDGTKMVKRTVLRSGQTGVKPLYTIEARGRTVRATASHEFLVRRKHPSPRSGKGGYRVVEWHNEWVAAEKLTTEDYILAAHNVAAKISGSPSAPNGRRLTEKFMEFCGLYVAEGSMGNRYVTIARHKDAAYMNAYRDAIRAEFSSLASVRLVANGGQAVSGQIHLQEYARATTFSSASAVRELTELGFRGTAHTKRIPAWVFDVKREMQLAFLRGYLDGDGTVNKRGWITWSSVSRDLIEDVRHLCMLAGVPCGLACDYPILLKFDGSERDEPGTIWQAWCFSVAHNKTIGSHDPRYLKRWESAGITDRVGRFDPEYVGRGAGGARPGVGFDVDGVCLSRIVKISYSEVVEAVYDIEVNETHNFIADGVVVHNSGVENIINAWLTLGLDAFLRNIEWSINRWLLTLNERRKFYAEFDRDSLLRNDSAARAALINSMIQNAQMTPNEGRKKLNRLPLPGGDIALVNSTLVPLTQVGNRTPARVQPAPGEPIPEPTPEPTPPQLPPKGPTP